MKIGLVGLPVSGKSTLYSLLTGVKDAEKIVGQKANIATARVPDQRVDFFSALYKPKKTTYAQIDFTDLPGLNISEQRAKGKNPFLTSVRNVDALLAVLRVFRNGPPHILESINPRRDLEVIHTELLFDDWGVIEKRLQRLEEKKKKEDESELPLLIRCREELEKDGRLDNLSFTPEEKELLRGFSFLTLKPLLIALNLDEEQYKKKKYPEREAFHGYLQEKGLPYIEVAALIEKEINDLSSEDRRLFLEDLGIRETGIDRLARAVYHHLGLISFFTVGEDEVKAWTIPQGTTAVKAAGKIHSDLEKGFIRAEVASFRDFQEQESMAGLREKGLLRLEGRDYLVQDGDIINIRFNL